MVRQPAAEEAARVGPRQPQLGVGLHLDLWESVTQGDGWRRLYQRCAEEPQAIAAAEVRAQLARFVTLLGRPPDHLDTHQHVHRREPVASVGAGTGGPKPVCRCAVNRAYVISVTSTARTKRAGHGPTRDLGGTSAGSHRRAARGLDGVRLSPGYRRCRRAAGLARCTGSSATTRFAPCAIRA